MRGSVCGYVVRADDGTPVAKTTIDVVSGPGSAPAPVVVTDSDGSFALTDLSEGEWVLSARSPSGCGQTATVHVFDNALSDVTIGVTESPRVAQRVATGQKIKKNKMERGMSGSVRGRVMRADNGKPLEDATITVVRGSGPAPDISPLTDRAGWFVLDGLLEGEWLLQALGPGGETGESTVQVSAGSVADITINVMSNGTWGVPESD